MPHLAALAQQSMAGSSVSVLPGQMGNSCSSKASCSGSAAPAVSGSQGAWLPWGVPSLAPAFFSCLSKVLRCWEKLWGKAQLTVQPQAFSIKTTGKSHSLEDKLGSMVSAPPDQAVLQWGVG